MDANASSRFPVLDSLAGILKISGWILAVLAALGVVMAFGEAIKDNHTFRPTDMVPVVGAFCGVLIGLGVVAFSELIGVALAIERNTRLASQSLKRARTDE